MPRAVLFFFILSVTVNIYQLKNHLFFGHEQGRDAYVARGIYTLKDFTLIGPTTEIQGLFTPPWYYYLLAIPYGIAKGNPIMAAYVQTIIVSITAPIIYLLFRKLTNDTSWSYVAAIFSAFSFEYISYARWLSNVPPAIPLSTLAFYFLVAFWQTKKQKYLTLFGIFASLASVFQVVLIFQFIFVLALLIIAKIIKRPEPKTLLPIALFALAAAGPLILFDMRNQHISSKAILEFVRGSSDYPLRLNLPSSAVLYFKELFTISKRTLFNFNNPILLITFWTLTAAGLIQFVKKSKNRQILIVSISFALMGLGIFIFNIGLTQLYLATNTGLILLFTISMRTLWTSTKTRIFALILSVLWLASLAKNLTFLSTNQGMFFVTTTEGINYRDQKAVLEFVRLDAGREEYRLEAFTVPYLKPQGWQYLHEYFFGEGDNKTVNLVYIIIQKNVEDFWRQRWTDELGPSNLVLKKQFGQILLEKRYLAD